MFVKLDCPASGLTKSDSTARFGVFNMEVQGKDMREYIVVICPLGPQGLSNKYAPGSLKPLLILLCFLLRFCHCIIEL